MSFEPDEPYDVHRKIIRTARIEHVCCACRCIIKPGDRYAFVATVFDGTAQSFKRCGRCETIHAHLVKMGDGGMYPMEQLDCGQSYENEWGPCPDNIVALAFMTEDEAGKLLEKHRE